MAKKGEIPYPLFETRRATDGWLITYRLFSISLFIGIFSIWLYRFSHLFNIHGGVEEEDDDGEKSWVVWVGSLAAELFFGLYWLLTQALRWNPVFRQTFKHRLSQRYEHSLPGVDVFVCTADTDKEPPMMVMNTVLSVMAYDYPSDKLSVYLSDDAASEITFYALLETRSFAKKWLPFCKRFHMEPRSPSAHLDGLCLPTSSDHDDDSIWIQELAAIKKLYDDMERRIEDATKSGQVPRDVRSMHKGFSQWDAYSSRRDHDTILKILLHTKDSLNSKDADGSVMPTLVYVAREKRPQYHHHFKAGAMNSLIRVSSKISNGKIILNVDCDMASNSSESVRDALCFFMDEEKGHEIAFVQFPQNFVGVTKNDLYANHMQVFNKLEAHGSDGCGGSLYIGTGSFHRRDILCGRKFNDQHNTINDWNNDDDDQLIMEESLQKQEQESKPLASCTYEQNTLWGSEMGLIYGCAVEDVMTGLSIHSKGWRSVYCNPERKAFLGAPLTTLGQVLVQQKRWAEGEFQILVSKYSPPWHAYGKLSVGLQMVYCNYCFWAPKSLPILYYCIVPSLCLLKGIPLFPKISSPWFIPFAYVILAGNTSSLVEFLSCGGTVQGWWNEQRMWLYKRTSSFFFAFVESVLKLLGFPLASGFAITAKVAEQDASQRYEKEILEFRGSSPMFTLLATLAMLNLFCFFGVSMDALISEDGFIRVLKRMILQIMLCGVLVLLNVPIYEGLFFRKDKGGLPTSVAIKSTIFALSACVLFKGMNFIT
ncbi:cellulose synthase-like protein E1 [Neltuma alba]|uniref:cellulose synthase-like protein E1 n=1 Tax=Neltuma alba TaxID=207710 RepID=UPI0010A59C64|nr:cellulose synthase-like protein E1 [Prosopis alba]